ncbi:hypothetical protein [Avibacterium avium]|uniref:Lipoprotein n=1 Tax=Avibacterium avium TaxID=751 RepID=A0A379AQX1_AVIAV|nr:hypothetical protein [Avibacterium avium]SUB23473.1 Uncharacterised protein [Avibacterium avium]
MKKLATLITLFLTGCGVVGNQTISDETLKEKAAFALSTNANKVVISERKAGIDDIRFIATVGKKKYQCYITTVVVVSSDAVCSGTDGNKSSSCNALEKAAGRCK